MLAPSRRRRRRLARGIVTSRGGVGRRCRHVARERRVRAADHRGRRGSGPVFPLEAVQHQLPQNVIVLDEQDDRGSPARTPLRPASGSNQCGDTRAPRASSAFEQCVAMVTDAGVGRDRAVTVWALTPLHGMREGEGHKEQHNGERTQRQPSHETRGRGEVATLRRHIAHRGSKADPEQKSQHVSVR